MHKNERHEDITEQELMEILRNGEIRMKRLVVGTHSRLDGIELKWTNLPGSVLIGPLVRKNRVIIPHGDTRLKCGDDLVVFGTEKDMDVIKELLLAEGLFMRMKRVISKIFLRKKADAADVPEKENAGDD